MSRSRRHPIYKDHDPETKANYHRVVRRVLHQKVKACKYDPDKSEEIPKAQEIVNDYNYCDWVVDLKHWGDNSEIERASRK